MISQKNFEIRTVLYENDLVANGTCHNQSSIVSLSKRFRLPDSKKVFLIRLILETSINLLVKCGRENKFYFPLEKGRNPENTLIKTSLFCGF